MNRQGLLAAVLLAALGGACIVSFPRPWGDPQRLATAPITLLDGEQVTLHRWREPWILINIWAPDCVPCLSELPKLAHLQSRYRSELVVVGISPVNEREQAQSSAALSRVDYPLGQDDTGQLLRALGDVRVLPTNILLGPDRHVRWRDEGAVDEAIVTAVIDSVSPAQGRAIQKNAVRR